MKDNKTNATESEQAESTTNDTKQNSKSSSQSKQKNQNTNANANANSPDWLMHLLTGAGALGGNYILFIKPLQEKFDAMNKAILMQEKSIEDLQEQLALLNRKIKKTTHHQDEDVLEQNGDDLFTVKSKPKKNGASTNETKRTVRF
jgi:hypothetical protein